MLSKCYKHLHTNFIHIVFIFKHFYWIQVQLMVLFVLEILLYIAVKAQILSLSFYSVAKDVYNNFLIKLFSGVLFNNILIWICLDVIPFILVLYSLLENHEYNQNNIFHVSNFAMFFTGMFIGFDIIWVFYFFNQYITNLLIIMVRIGFPLFILKYFNSIKIHYNYIHNYCNQSPWVIKLKKNYKKNLKILSLKKK